LPGFCHFAGRFVPFLAGKIEIAGSRHFLVNPRKSRPERKKRGKKAYRGIFTTVSLKTTFTLCFNSLFLKEKTDFFALKKNLSKTGKSLTVIIVGRIVAESVGKWEFVVGFS
jgi:hypothetical protein